MVYGNSLYLCVAVSEKSKLSWSACMSGFVCRYFCRLFLFTRVVLQINNAGCMVTNRELTEDGLEKNFATNTLGEY